MVCVVPLWCPIRLFGLPSAAKLSRESRGYLLVLADLTHLWGGIFIGTTGTKVSIFHIFSECGSLMQLHDLLARSSGYSRSAIFCCWTSGNIYPESRNLFHYTALMTDPNSRGLTNSGNATICNGSTHWSITGGHLLCSPLTPHPPLSSFSYSGFQYEGEYSAFFQCPIPLILKTKKNQQQSNKQVLPAESSGQEAIRSSVCFAHQHKEAVDSLATPTLCPSAHQSFADTKRNVTCSSNGQRKQRADPRLPICSNWQWECRWVGMMLMSPAAGKGQWASEFVRKKLSKCWTLLTAGSVTTHRLGHQDKNIAKGTTDPRVDIILPK